MKNDSPYSLTIDGDPVIDVYIHEFLNTIITLGFPNYKRRLKSMSVLDAIKEYRYTIRVMKWDKTDYNMDGKICARGTIDIYK